MSDEQKNEETTKDEKVESFPSTANHSQAARTRMTDHELMMKEKRLVQQSRGNPSIPREPMARNWKSPPINNDKEIIECKEATMNVMQASTEASLSHHQAVLHDRLQQMRQHNPTDSNFSLPEHVTLKTSLGESSAPSKNATNHHQEDDKLSAHEIMMLEKTRIKNEMSRGLRQQRLSTVSTTDDSDKMRAKSQEKARRGAALASRPGVARNSSANTQWSTSVQSTQSTVLHDNRRKSAQKALPLETSAIGSMAREDASLVDTVDGKRPGRAIRAAGVASRPGVAWMPSQNSQLCSQRSMDSSKATSVGSNEEDSMLKQRVRESFLPSTAVPATRDARQQSAAEDHDRMVREKRAVAGQLFEWARGTSQDPDASETSGSEWSPDGGRRSPIPPNLLERSVTSRSAMSRTGLEEGSTRSASGHEGNLYQDKQFRSYLRDGLDQQMSVCASEQASSFDGSPAEAFTSYSAIISEPTAIPSDSAYDLQRHEDASVHSSHSNEEIEAQVGLPVIFPGAFAITGMDHENDDGYASADIQSVTTDYNMEHDHFTQEDHEEQAPNDDIGEVNPFEATLAEAAMTVEGAVIANDDELDKKTLRRLRTMQYVICMLAICAVALVTISVLERLSSVTGEKPIPTVDGWVAAGSTVVIPGEEAGTQFGKAIDMTRDGKKMAVVAPGRDDGLINNVGALYFFTEQAGLNGTEWGVTSENIKGPGGQTSTFASLAMSTEPVYIAVGYPDYMNGVVMLQKENEATNTIDFDVQLASNQTDSAWFGYSVDLSEDGSILAIGAPRSHSKNLQQTGAVYVFQRIGTVWARLGEPIMGGDQDEFSGWSVSIANNDGIRVAIGSPVFGDFTGKVRVVDWTGTAWKQVGETLEGEGTLNRYGESLDFSRDGKVLAIGARGTFYESPGYVTLFKEESGSWAQIGDHIRGQTEGEGFGASIALSDDGNVVAVGAPLNDDFGEGSGSIRVFEFDEAIGSWGQIGSQIGGQPLREYGSSVSLDSSGMRVAAGAPLSDYDGRITRAGSVGVFDRAQ
ncbi:hypothetical protein FisN_18Lh254 [Fistulifera solaris]|uniref:Uncharacterized protein n=1 Tax=Fistulifera solaris TaxID=1519565 RepID=A0A1Z5JUZ3_FISSO|nr:hypothetical protein FisN_18Lh254 [Fistulifera solaris]|eukprot:GAX17598.1 hypothetical protein FisN_18Lh254 [Fistulifera solaris]